MISGQLFKAEAGLTKADDVEFSDFSYDGGEIPTPNVDALALLNFHMQK